MRKVFYDVFGAAAAPFMAARNVRLPPRSAVPAIKCGRGSRDGVRAGLVSVSLCAATTTIVSTSNRSPLLSGRYHDRRDCKAFAPVSIRLRSPD